VSAGGAGRPARRSRSRIAFTPSRVQREFLELRGARRGVGQGGGPWSPGRVLGRRLDHLLAILAAADPRASGRLTQAQFDLAVEVLRRCEPWAIHPPTIVLLHLFIEAQLAGGGAAGVAPEAAGLVGAMGALSFVEKLCLVDAAEAACFAAFCAEEARRDRP
jgi:hypothetical protein